MATILYVDQDKAGQNFIQSVLGQQYHLLIAADGPTAIQYCAMLQPDLILIDLTSPEIDGPELTLRLKMFMPQTPILVIGKDQASVDNRWRELVVNADELLLDPIDAADLLHRVQTLVSAPVPLSDFTASLLDGEISKVKQFEDQIAALNRANNRLASLNAVSALVGTSLDLEHLMDEILTQIHKTTDFDSATLFLLKGNILEAAASRGFSEYQQGMYAYGEKVRNSAWQAVYHKLPLIINDVTRSGYWEPRPELDKIRSWLGVPLIYKDRVVGVLTLDKNQPNAFSDAEARYLFTLAYQIAIAVENAQLFEEWEEQATRLKLINEVAQEINTFLDVDELFAALARSIFERLRYDHVAIFELDQTRSVLLLKAIHGERPVNVKSGVYQQAARRNLLGQAIQSGRPLVLNDISQRQETVGIEGLAVRSVLIVPIYVGTQIEALICVGQQSPNGFSDQDLWTVSSLGSQAGIAVKNAWLYRGLDTYSDKLEKTIAARTQRLQAIKKISQVVSQGLDIDELLAVVGRGMGQIFAPNVVDDLRVTIGLVSGANVVLREIYTGSAAGPRTPAAGKQNEERLTFKIDPQRFSGQVLTQAKPKILNDVNRRDVYPLAAGSKAGPIKSLLMAPLITGGKTVGLIVVESQLVDAFDDGDLETLETVAFQVASAIEHARLLQKTREIAIIEERTRLARDMHDGVAQNLAYLLIQVDRCLNGVEEGSRLEAQLEQISLLLKQNIGELRRNIFDLRPVALEGKTLFEVFEEYVTEFGRRWNLKTNCTVPRAAVEISPEIERSLYRILQETLSNVQQHAACSRLSVNLAVKKDKVTLEVIDDGQGFDLAQQGSGKFAGKGFGLISIRERVERAGGQLTVESLPGQGTRIFTTLPLYASIT
ncbi:MAG: GAF domain-containing protein [Chloroflexota bacterium]